MKSIQNHFLLLIACIFVGLSSCNKDSILDDDLPTIDGNLGLDIVSYYRKPSTLTFEKNYIFSKAVVGIKEVIFSDNENSKPEFSGNFITNLVTNTTEPSIPYATLEVGNYDNIIVKCESHLENNQTIILEGNYHPDGVQVHPFTFSSNFEDALVVTVTKPITLQEEKIHKVSIIFDLASVFDQIDFDNAHQEKDGSINFDDEKNASLHQEIEQRLKTCLRVHQIQ